MTDTVQPLGLTDHDPPGVWPWIIAAAAAIATGIVTLGVVERIPRQLGVEASQRLEHHPSQTIDLQIDGRDIELAGTIAPDADRDALIADLAAIDGARIVRDEMVVVDPVAEQAERRRSFQQALSSIDLSSVAFEPGSADFASGSEAALDTLVQLMSGESGFRLRVAGHTDDTGRAAANLELSRDRAQRVRAYLADQGIDGSRVVAQGYGDTQPVADNATESGRARNRRIEIHFAD